ncbi:hypothetical protein QJQ58_03375 [Paenibacillus dendritiformis]|uniref:hypothetical protein n=1 Tax=Paenibacillus dendritiformis TaxID=130049 RepID=UPI00248D2600|nr:hypothetical protein [Paenibacillus dendritiformis]WGU95324.1 hypothetical protein QJQ58_03375 [Paenibacillus dendritiformis]
MLSSRPFLSIRNLVDDPKIGHRRQCQRCGQQRQTACRVGYDGRLASGSLKVQRTTGIIFTSNDGINWKEINRSPGAQANENKGKVDLGWLPVNAVTWDGERFIAGTNQGQTLVSPDGLTWKFIIPEQDIRVENIPLHQTHGGLRADIHGIYADKEQVITVGSLGTIRTAAPAMAAWQVAEGGEVRALSKAAASGGRIVALGQGIIVESNDGGRHWNVHRSEEIERSYFYSFVADKGSQKWKPAHYVTSSVDKIASDGNQFVGLSSNSYSITTSANGADWQEVHTSYGMNAIAYGKGMYVVVCRGGKLLISKDGVHWEEKDSISAEISKTLSGMARSSLSSEPGARYCWAARSDSSLLSSMHNRRSIPSVRGCSCCCSGPLPEVRLGSICPATVE